MEKKQKALNVLAELSGVARDDIKPEMDLVADLDIDSPTALRLLVELESAWGVEISDEDAARLETVGDVLAYADAVH